MELFFLSLVLVFWLLFFLYLLRAIHINQKTYFQRMYLIEHSPNVHFMTWFDAVSYDDHYNALFWKHDLKKIYPQECWEMLDRMGKEIK